MTTEPLTEAPILLHTQPMLEAPPSAPPLAALPALPALPAMTEDALWRAVETRDARLDGLFVYAVRSTGIYCRPSCPSRRPRRDRAVFFASAEAAEGGGFRACRRCRPRTDAARDPQLELAVRACRAIEAYEEGMPSLAALAAGLDVSPHHLQRTFKSLTGVTPHQYAAALRARRLKSLLRAGEGVAAALYEAGYGSSSRLYEASDAQLGMTPATYRRGGRGMEIRYAVVPCPLGRLLVAATARGICAVELGEDDGLLAAALAAEYPAARIERGEGSFPAWVQGIAGYLAGERGGLDLPLDVQATAFELRVWEALRKIPYGETRSYGEVAAALGAPRAARAVARACAANPAALVTPCHRVVRADGQPGGYRWGEERKRALLAMERGKG
jgi:AraC family transcriptional regulator of adaptative response/methylated-DNA-[protein]-cysteine methyltransferase